GCLSHRDKHPRFFASVFTHAPFSPESTPLQHQRFKTPAKGSDFWPHPEYQEFQAPVDLPFFSVFNGLYSGQRPKFDPLAGVLRSKAPPSSDLPKTMGHRDMARSLCPSCA
ncbi:hypothetical protein, partial [Enorma massiliensis]|uniref:hypothetical protein n=1 Tax=Enorma massiliensis TaxID=1472761 RepID=UPI003A948EC2